MAVVYISCMTKTTPRLYIRKSWRTARPSSWTTNAAHYIRNVLRMAAGDALRVFNETDGEWLCHVTEAGKKRVEVRCERALAAVRPPPDVDYVFAPLKHARLDYMVQKATELGARTAHPCHYTADHRRARQSRPHACQCHRGGRAVQSGVCARGAGTAPLGKPPARLGKGPQPGVLRRDTFGHQPACNAAGSLLPPTAVLVGPEGGFTPEEKQLLYSLPFVRPISLGPRIMRADTAAIAASRSGAGRRRRLGSTSLARLVTRA